MHILPHLSRQTPRRPLSHVARPHSAAEVGSSPTIRTVHLRAQTEGGSRHKGRRGKLGFSIRGGAEHGMGIYVSSVDEGSAAEKQGLAAGDQICSVNQISFKNTSQDEAARVRIIVYAENSRPGTLLVWKIFFCDY